MLPFSLKEYKIIKDDIIDIKQCITRYIGYIISVASIAVFFVKYVFPESEKYFDLTNKGIPIKAFVLLTSLFVATFLFEIIWYKFISHNRHVGYLQLMGQELGYYRYDRKVNRYFGNDGKIEVKDISENDNFQLISWEFVMARYNNVAHNKDPLKFTESFSKLNFELDPLTNRSMDSIDYESKKRRYYRKYVEKCVMPLYGRSGIRVDVKSEHSILGKVSHGITNLLSLWVNPKRRNYHSDRIDRHYISVSWLYPRKILQIAILVVIGVSWLFFYEMSKRYSFNLIFKTSNIEEAVLLVKRISWTAVILILLWFVTILRWITEYLYNIRNLITGSLSIDYFCWLFFVYRVQILNRYGICPIFFARGFKRYLKSQFYLKFIKTQLDLDDVQLKNWIRRKFDANVAYYVNREFLDGYSMKLKESLSFNEREKEFHELLKHQVNEDKKFGTVES